MDGPQLKATDVVGLSDLSVEIQNCALTLIQMGYEADINSSDKLVKIMRRLPIHLQSKWDDTAGQLTLRGIEPTFSHLAKFVEERAMLANTMYGEFVGSTLEKERRIKQQSKEKTADHRSKGKSFATQVGTRDGPHPNVTSPVSSCPLCSGQHWLAKCERMKTMTPGERKSFVRQTGLCDNCFGRGHIAINCRSKMKCQVNGCGWKHHTMLHLQKKNNDGNTPPNKAGATPDADSTSVDIVSGAGESGRCGATESGKKNVCLRIVPVVVKGQGQNGEIVTNALLDPGSDVSLCDVGLLEKLGVVGHPEEFTPTTVNGASDSQNGFELSLVARGINLHEEIMLSRVWAVDPLRLPRGGAPTKEDTDKWSHLKGIKFPRIQSDEVLLLIGCDVPEAHWMCDQRRGRRGQPYAVCTPLRWTLMGPLNSCANNCFSVNFVRHDDAVLHQQMERMFRNDFNEPMVASKTAMSVEDRRALAQMEGSMKIINGHYQLGLPWRQTSVRLSSQLRELLSRGGFRLTKWISNDRNLIASVPMTERAPSVVNLDLDDLPTERTLGVQWDMETDSFSFRILDQEKAPTRRGILSVVSSMYDPLGFVAPVILHAKSLLQSLCNQKYGWDEEISEEDYVTWQGWLRELNSLRTLSVPRCFKPTEFSAVARVELHHFSDASEYGYGAVSYLRIVDDGGVAHCSFVLGKSRVAPLKVMSIPRLELTAAVVAAKLNRLIRNELEYPIDDTVFWTDSTVVLQYIRNESRRFQMFVTNRVAMIHEESTPKQWRHVNTESNPADVASRGAKGSELHKMDLWLHGPMFLRKDEASWPEQPLHLPDLSGDDNELKKPTGHANLIASGKGIELLYSHYSSWDSLRKAIAWMARFKKYMLSRSSNAQDHVPRGPLTVPEVIDAEKDIVKVVQNEAFPKEIDAVNGTAPGNRKKSLPRTSPVRDLNPYVTDGILRVGGRLENASVSFEVKHPIILPSKHHVTNLIIQNCHRQQGHSGPAHVLAAIRQKFWIVRGLSAVRKVLARCMDYRKRNARPGEQIMAPLPVARVAPFDPPFTHVGVDYLGPLFVKQGGSEVKRYGCLFTCLTMRAVHIEVAHTLEADSLICANQRFVSRRGRPRAMYSDNGTNFTGAERELREAFERLDQRHVCNRLRKDDVQWFFNPPEASHQGGIWERMIRSVRKILTALLKEQRINDETLSTLLCEVEKILNDLPLTSLSDHPDNPEPLTPNKLLLLKSNSCLPLDVFTDQDKYSKRWCQAQCLANAFWKRWMKDYLPVLQRKQKCYFPRRNFAIGDLVLVIDEKVPRGRWPMGLVQEVFPDSNGHVRSVRVKTASSVCK